MRATLEAGTFLGVGQFVLEDLEPARASLHAPVPARHAGAQADEAADAVAFAGST
jgi:hypothetical protein